MPNASQPGETGGASGRAPGTLAVMEITQTRWHGLARSSPWRWRTVHFTFERAGSLDPVRAWIVRPGVMRVETGGEVHVMRDRPDTSSTVGLGGGYSGPVTRPDARDIEPVRDDDGFVALRPSSFAMNADDPMWQSYDWVAMLDPVELADGDPWREGAHEGVESALVTPDPFPDLLHPTTLSPIGTSLSDLRVTNRRGRETWWAQVVPRESYAPRCGCCPLLWGEISERFEREAGGPTLDPPIDDYPAAYEVALDVQTGICVAVHPVEVVPRTDLGFDVTIHEVDAAYPDELFATQP